MNKLFYLLLILIFVGFFAISDAAIKVTPTILELNANSSRGNYLTSAFEVQGGKNETIRFKVYSQYFKISKEGTMEIFEQTEEADSLIKHVRFVPNEFTLINGKSQKVRLTFANLQQLPEGESRMVLFLEDVAAKEVVLPNANNNVATKLIVKTRVGIPVYVDKGHFVKCADVESFRVEKQNNEIKVSLKLLSSGNSKVRYSGKAQIVQNKNLIAEYPIKSNVVGSNNVLFAQNDIPLNDIKQNGDYMLRLILNYIDEKGRLKNIIKEEKFTVSDVVQSAI